ncbi:MAG: hypothetical protein ACTSPB_11950 [Candidatus Thorarchaeota archaeon]
MSEWKLYVWTEVLCDYTCGMAFAIARSKEEAYEAYEALLGVYIKEELIGGKLKTYELPELQLDEPICEYVYGGG